MYNYTLTHVNDSQIRSKINNSVNDSSINIALRIRLTVKLMAHDSRCVLD